MKTLLSILGVLLISLNLFSQSKFNSKIFKEADSIIIVSHEATDGVLIVNDNTGKRLSPPPLLISGRLNQSIIKERKKLDSASIQNLVKILRRPFEDRTIEEGKCFIPHHAILIYRTRKISYIEICFGCRGFETTKDLRFIGTFDKRKWKQLEAFFKINKFSYEMPLE